MARRDKPNRASSARERAPFDGKAFGQEMVKIVKGYMARRTASLEERITALEARLADLEDGRGQ